VLALLKTRFGGSPLLLAAAVPACQHLPDATVGRNTHAGTLATALLCLAIWKPGWLEPYGKLPAAVAKVLGVSRSSVGRTIPKTYMATAADALSPQQRSVLKGAARQRLGVVLVPWQQQHLKQQPPPQLPLVQQQPQPHEPPPVQHSSLCCRL